MATHIMLIEDNETNLELMRYLLTAFGYVPISAGNGEEGLAEIRRSPPELIVCDIHLPGMDGYQIAARLKSDADFRGIPLIAVTAMAMVGDHDKIIKAGFDGCITKPIDPQTFVGEIEAFLQPHDRSTRSKAKTVRDSSSASRPIVPVRAHILVLDNMPVNLDLIRSTLEPSGYNVTSASTVQEALALARASSPDLILSDLHLPSEDGLDFLRLVKAEPALRGIPFVFLSSSVTGESERLAATLAGATRFIVRPIEPQDLLGEIESCLRKNGRHR